jgi:biopolymer transport protein ExbD
MIKRSSCIHGVTVGLAYALLACGGAEEKPAEQGEKPPVIGVFELPVSLRTGDAAPADGRKVELGLTELRVDGETVMPLDGGKLAPSDRSGNELPKLKAALQQKPSKTLVLHAHSGIAYETIAAILSTAHAAGMRDLAFQVRKAGGATDTGYVLLKNFQVTPRTDDEVAIESVDARKWDEMTAEWEKMHNACRAAETGSCAYVPGTPAKGGNLKIVLHAAGQGVNLDFFRVGIPAEQLAAEEAARQAELAKKKEDVVQGRKKATDIAEELDEAEAAPADQALFQFRSNEALEVPSALSETMRPLCGNRACGAVVSAESATLFVRVASLIGAAFPDGGAAPVLAFELPWTEKPKPAIPTAVPAAPVPAK